MIAKSTPTQPMSASVKQLQGKPMRLALVLLDYGYQLSPDNQSTLQTVLVDAHNVSVNHHSEDGFEQALFSALTLMAESSLSVINLDNKILLLPALTAAKNKLHAHAFLTGVATDTDNQQSLTQALLHAKRQHVSPLLVDMTAQSVNVQSSENKWHSFVELVTQLSARINPQNQQFWFTLPHQSRVAAFQYASHAGDIQSWVFTQGSALINSQPLLNDKRLFLPLSGQSKQQLHTQLQAINAQIEHINQQPNSSQLLIELMQQLFTEFVQVNNAPLAERVKQKSLVLMAQDGPALQLEAQAMLAQFDKCQSDSLRVKTPSGSCVNLSSISHESISNKSISNESSAASDQLNPAQGLTFVYPGVGTVYPNMFAEFGHAFPHLYANLEAEGSLSEMFQAEFIYPTLSETASTAKPEMGLGQMAIAGVGACYMLTKLLQQQFAIEPQFAMGYSMGEAAMWSSLGVWQAPHQMIEATKTSSIFTHDISGSLNCVRQDWQLTDNETIQWNSFVVRATEAEISPHLAEFPHAYLAIIQGDTCVIAGCEASCKALLSKAGKRGIAANRVTAMHTKPAMQIIDDVKQFYLQPLCATLPQNIQFISAMEAAPVTVAPDAIAQSIADTFCHPLNFTHLVEKAYQFGGRLFVEIGADRQTTTLIDKIDHGSPILEQAQAIAINGKSGDDLTHLLKCLAQLMVNGVPMSLAPFTDSLSIAWQRNIHLQAKHITHTELLQGEPH